jgi:hypothetical protein
MSKQLKISDLKRVVNVDVISKYAQILNNEGNKDEKQIEEILTKLGEKTPSREVLLQTRLGFILRDLSVREGLSTHLREKARDLRTKWKDFHKNLLLAPKYDVKCDKPTTENRERAKKSLFNQFLNSSPASRNKYNFETSLEANVVELEFTIFKHCDTLINKNYFITVRKCLRVIDDNLELRNYFLNYEIDSEEFLKRALKLYSTAPNQAQCDEDIQNENIVTLD